MIDYPLLSDEDDLKAIWKQVFGDSDEFIDLFFRNRYSVDSALVYRQAGRITSMIFFPGYDFKYGENYGRLGYICGAATLPDFRGRGIMSELIAGAFDEMRSRGDEFSALIPASDSLYAYYAKFGYQDFFYRKRYVVKRVAGDGEPSYRLLPAADFERIYEIYSEAVTQLSTVVIQSSDIYRSVVDEFRLSGGEIYLSDDRRLYCFVRSSGDTLHVREMFSLSESDDPYQGLTRSLLNQFPKVNSIEIEGPASHIKSGSSVIRTGMLKILTEEADSLIFNDQSGYMKFMLED
jgi:predicted acetyltransferase